MKNAVYPVLAGLVLGADQALKAKVRGMLPEGGTLREKEDGEEETLLDTALKKTPVVIRRVENRGAAGNLGEKYPGVCLALSSGVLALAGAALVKSLSEEKTGAMAKTGLALIVGGGLSNVADRSLRGSVTDYITFEGKKKETERYVQVKGSKAEKREHKHLVYNLGDFAIGAGALLLALSAAKEEE